MDPKDQNNPSNNQLNRIEKFVKKNTKNKLNLPDFNRRTSKGLIEYYKLEDPSVIERAKDILRVSRINNPVK